MNRNRGVAQIRIETRHGEQRSITIIATRSSMNQVLIGVAAAAMVLFVALASWHFSQKAEPVAPPVPHLVVQVDPPSGEIYVDDQLISSSGALDTTDGLVTDRPFEVRIELDGFSIWRQDVSVKPGETVTLKPILELKDPMNFSPAGHLIRGEVDTDRAQQLMSLRTDRFEQCFDTYLTPGGAPSDRDARLKVEIIVSPRGYIVGWREPSANFDSPRVLDCLQRELRAIRFPLVPGDYGVLPHTFIYTPASD